MNANEINVIAADVSSVFLWLPKSNRDEAIQVDLEASKQDGYE